MQGPEWLSSTPHLRNMLRYSLTSLEASEQLLLSKGLVDDDGCTRKDLFSSYVGQITSFDDCPSGALLFYRLRVKPPCAKGTFPQVEAADAAAGYDGTGWLVSDHINAFGNLLRTAHPDAIVFVNSHECEQILREQDPYASRTKNKSMMVRYDFVYLVVTLAPISLLAIFQT